MRNKETDTLTPICLFIHLNTAQHSTRTCKYADEFWVQPNNRYHGISVLHSRSPAPGLAHLETPDVRWAPLVWLLVLLWTPRRLHHHCLCPGECGAWTTHPRSLCLPAWRAAGVRIVANSGRVSDEPAEDATCKYKHLSAMAFKLRDFNLLDKNIVFLSASSNYQEHNS